MPTAFINIVLFFPTVPQEDADGPSELDVVAVRDGQRGGGRLRAGRAQGHREAAARAHAAVRRPHRLRAAAHAGPGAGHEGDTRSVLFTPEIVPIVCFNQ